jgi:hypothetical protein
MLGNPVGACLGVLVGSVLVGIVVGVIVGVGVIVNTLALARATSSEIFDFEGELRAKTERY